MGQKDSASPKKKPCIDHVDDAHCLAQTALKYFLRDAKESIDQRGKFRVAISGGHTPERFFQLLAEDPTAGEIPWENVDIFWVDERCVPPDAQASNYALAAHSFIDKINIPDSNVHRVMAEVNDYSQAVEQYEQNLRSVFALKPGQIPEFDLIVLGMGADGHIASLFPNSYAHFDTEDLVTTVYLLNGDYNRITLTYPVLREARHLIVLISGDEKADIVKEVLLGEPDDVKYPAHTLWPSLHKITWIVDSDAGKHL